MELDMNIENNLSSFKLKVNLKQSRGILGLLGASGSGKSMTLKAIAGLIKPTKGYIKLNDTVLFDSDHKINLRPQERKVGLLFQNYALFPHMNVIQNIECGIMHIDENKRRALVQDYIERFKLQGLEKHYPKELSGGQMQRVALARTLITNPDILLLDEPFSALDINLKSTIERDLISILNDYDGIVLYVTHDISEAYRICDEIIAYDNGTALNKRKKHDLFNYPQSIIEAKLTGCNNLFTAKKIDSHTVYAQNLGYELKTDTAVTDDISCIGIRAHNIIFSHPSADNKSQPDYDNIIKDSNFNDMCSINCRNLDNSTNNYIKNTDLNEIRNNSSNNIDTSVNQQNNTYKFKIVNIIENPFTNTVILKNPDDSFMELIEAEVSKDIFSYNINDEIYAQLKKESLFYF